MKIDRVLDGAGLALLGGACALFIVEGFYGFDELRIEARLVLIAGLLSRGIAYILETRRAGQANKLVENDQ